MMPTEPAALWFGLKATTLEKNAAVFRQYPQIERALLYGLRAKGNYRPGSDIDLTLVGSEITYQQLTRIETQLDDLLLPYLFDMSIFSHIEDPDVVEHIQRVSIVFYDQGMPLPLEVIGKTTTSPDAP